MSTVSQLHSATATWEDFIATDEDDPRELVDGRLEATEMPTKLHEWIVGSLYAYLWNWARANHAGLVLPSGYKIRIDPNRGVMPDVIFIRQERAKLADEQGMTRGAPDLVIEVISPTSGSHDRVRKLNWYASIAVGEYWLVDPGARTLERFTLGSDGRYAVSGSASTNDVFSPATFAGLAIPLGELWLVPGDEE